ncbi:uncharacterized protein N7500_006401 [Penicillium coprophilum]|uniref:uncharacterized protein n=1 Tax=Penicillium coprophilum TaxID=36646 RepID=UPI0023A2DF8B|nr:uncharacterized protein N7500_006401 [Penicillium coprophilum]KAJ5164571.1 hypothetical protein N7500_006401 [Penicillium coprophilum]
MLLVPFNNLHIAYEPITNEKIEIESSHLQPDPLSPQRDTRFGFRSVKFGLNCVLAQTPAWQVTRHSQRAFLFSAGCPQADG